jgi:hypothetical protein
MVNRKTGTFSMEVKKTVDKGVRQEEEDDPYSYCISKTVDCNEISG